MEGLYFARLSVKWASQSCFFPQLASNNREKPKGMHSVRCIYHPVYRKKSVRMSRPVHVVLQGVNEPAVDQPCLKETFLFRLSNTSCMEWFMRVIVDGSRQDLYATMSSTRILSASSDVLSIMIFGEIMCTLNADKFNRLDSNFGLEGEPSTDLLIRRAKFLEFALFNHMLILIYADMFDF